MRILMVGSGNMTAVRRVLDWVCRRGDQVCLVSNGNPYARQMPANYTFVPCDIHLGDIDLKLSHDELTNLTAEQQAQYQPIIEQLRRLAAAFQPDVVHVHYLTTLTDCCVKAGLKPLVVSAWGMLNSLLTQQTTSTRQITNLEISNLAVRQMVAAAAGLIVESPALLECCQRLEARPAYVALIPLGANTRSFRPLTATQRLHHRRALAIAADTVVILSPRGWSKVYQQRQILTAYHLARLHFTKPTTLVFLKLDRENKSQATEALYQTLEQEVARLGLTAEVRWLPEMRYEMMPALYGMADLIVNYPRTDAFPSTLIEAAACECPIITIRLPSYRNTFVEEFCTLVEPTQPDEAPLALAQAMIELVNGCPQQRKPQLQVLRQVIIDQYDESIAQQRLFSFYEHFNR